MNIKIKSGDIFKEDVKYDFVHCVASDIVTNPKSGTQGIAKQFQDKYMFKDILKLDGIENITVGSCMYTEGIFHLVTKPKYWLKPTNDTMLEALLSLKNLCIERNTKYLAMPKIGCGLDKLDWDDVYEMISQTFTDTDINIVIYLND